MSKWTGLRRLSYNSRGRVGGAGGAAAPSFTPDDLFAASEAGGWYDPSDLSTLWKDTAGTDPVTADGDAVARMDDKSGNGNHVTQGTAAARPVYKTSGGLHWLLYDGVEDYAGATWSTVIPQPSTFVVAAEKAASNRLVAETTGTNNSRCHLETNASSDFLIYANSSAITIAIPADASGNFVGLGEFNGASSKIRANGSENSPVDPGPADSGGFRTGADNVNPPINFAPATFFGGLATSRILTAQEKTDVESYFADKAGVTL